MLSKLSTGKSIEPEKQAVVENETGSKTSETPTGVDHHLSRKERYDR
ncbi:hypothetical protein ACFSF7_04940 [Ligilactobacillus acidipiscis]